MDKIPRKIPETPAQNGERRLTGGDFLPVISATVKKPGLFEPAQFETLISTRPDVARTFVGWYQERHGRTAWPAEIERLKALDRFVDHEKIKGLIGLIKRPDVKERLKRALSPRRQREVEAQLLYL